MQTNRSRIVAFTLGAVIVVSIAGQAFAQEGGRPGIRAGGRYAHRDSQAAPGGRPDERGDGIRLRAQARREDWQALPPGTGVHLCAGGRGKNRGGGQAARGFEARSRGLFPVRSGQADLCARGHQSQPDQAFEARHDAHHRKGPAARNPGQVKQSRVA